jgi:RND family efflux transporter MFP subunit
VKAEELGLESKRQDIAINSAQLDQAKISLNLAQLQLSYTKIEAPIDGVISTRPVQVGNIISSGISNVGGGTTVMTLSDLSRIFCYATVDESDIGSVQVGQPAEITADSFPRKQFTGEVVRIATTGINLQNVVTFQVRIEITSENKALLKPQMTTNVTIVIADKPDVLQIPANAVIRKKAGDTVRVMAGGDPEGEERIIEIGISDGRSTEVVGGLKEGDEVIEQNPAEETRWAAGGDNPARNKARQQMMMMRTMGGSTPGAGGRH